MLNQVIDTVVVPEAASGSANTSLLYFGHIASVGSDFDRVNFVLNGVQGRNDDFKFDSFTIGNRQQVVPVGNVPEPGALALASVGLVGAGWVRRRRAAA